MNFRTSVLGFRGQVHRDLNIKVKTAISVKIRIFYIIRAFNEPNIRLTQKHIFHIINIVNIAAHNAHTGNVVKVLLRRFNARGKAALNKFVVHASGRFKSALNMMNRIAMMMNPELTVEDFKFQPQLHHGSSVYMLQFAQFADICKDVVKGFRFRQPF